MFDEFKFKIPPARVSNWIVLMLMYPWNTEDHDNASFSLHLPICLCCRYFEAKLFSFYFWLCREDVWVPGRLTDIHCSQIQIGPIKHSRQKTALIKDSQQSFNVNFLLFLTDSGTLKCPWRPWNLKYIGANFNIVALAWVCSTSLWAIHRDLPRSTGNIFKASKIFIPIHVHLTQLAMAAVTGLSVLLVTFHLLMCSLFFVTVY